MAAEESRDSLRRDEEARDNQRRKITAEAGGQGGSSRSRGEPRPAPQTPARPQVVLRPAPPSGAASNQRVKSLYDEHDAMVALRRQARVEGDADRVSALQEEIDDLKSMIARAESAAVEEAPPPPRRPKGGARGKGGGGYPPDRRGGWAARESWSSSEGWSSSDKRPRY